MASVRGEEEVDSGYEGTMLRYKEYFEELTDESVEELRELASPDVRYRDPFMDARSIEAVVAYLHRWFANLDDNKFEILEHAIDGKLLLSCWLGAFRLKRLPKKRWELYGLSKTVYDDAGKVADHRDYYDSSPILEYFPVLGRSVALIRKLYMR
jgi:limonene-1,2-epoxide hydrolase